MIFNVKACLTCPQLLIGHTYYQSLHAPHSSSCILSNGSYVHDPHPATCAFNDESQEMKCYYSGTPSDLSKEHKQWFMKVCATNAWLYNIIELKERNCWFCSMKCIRGVGKYHFNIMLMLKHLLNTIPGAEDVAQVEKRYIANY